MRTLIGQLFVVAAFLLGGAFRAIAETEAPQPAIVSTISESELKNFEQYPERVKILLRAALDLTRRNLTYKYGSADPSQGGMDCSGAVYYVLKQAGIANPPRSSADQYVWVRKARTFESVVSTRMDSFELAELRPGDLLFWTGTYQVERDPPVTHAMFYLGKAKSDGVPLMVGASNGRSYRGTKQYGVSVFDFRIPQPRAEGPNRASRFIGYAKVPGLDRPQPPSGQKANAAVTRTGG